ncbi:hypothetical protein ACKS23_02364 [Histoplasma ohiense]
MAQVNETRRGTLHRPVETFLGKAILKGFFFFFSSRDPRARKRTDASARLMVLRMRSIACISSRYLR